jgi:hypothetical protein
MPLSDVAPSERAPDAIDQSISPPPSAGCPQMPAADIEPAAKEVGAAVSILWPAEPILVGPVLK